MMKKLASLLIACLIPAICFAAPYDSDGDGLIDKEAIEKVQPDWNQTTTDAYDYILNKPLTWSDLIDLGVTVGIRADAPICNPTHPDHTTELAQLTAYISEGYIKCDYMSDLYLDGLNVPAGLGVITISDAGGIVLAGMNNPIGLGEVVMDDYRIALEGLGVTSALGVVSLEGENEEIILSGFNNPVALGAVSLADLNVTLEGFNNAVALGTVTLDSDNNAITLTGFNNAVALGATTIAASGGTPETVYANNNDAFINAYCPQLYDAANGARDGCAQSGAYGMRLNFFAGSTYTDRIYVTVYESEGDSAGNRAIFEFTIPSGSNATGATFNFNVGGVVGTADVVVQSSTHSSPPSVANQSDQADYDAAGPSNTNWTNSTFDTISTTGADSITLNSTALSAINALRGTGGTLKMSVIEYDYDSQNGAVANGTDVGFYMTNNNTGDDATDPRLILTFD